MWRAGIKKSYNILEYNSVQTHLRENTVICQMMWQIYWVNTQTLMSSSLLTRITQMALSRDGWKRSSTLQPCLCHVSFDRLWLPTHKEAQKHNGWLVNPKNFVREVIREAMPCPDARASAPGAADGTHQVSPQEKLCGSPHWLRGSLSLWGSMRCMGRVFWDCTSIVRGCLGEEPKAEEGRDQGGLREEQVWENGGIRR